MIPSILITIALVIIVIRSGYVALNMLKSYRNNNILDLLYHLSIFVIALSFLI
ncbi:hypothetical protein [Alkalihalobacterium elongatum]|uniref:hypothetical protein n=1 Tax=Alkalihalobacterium elongatum TaxID=2675466 RepID=UPI001C1F4E98|nr:hypothetical protein [Alkalihalobacterium elongatum]